MGPPARISNGAGGGFTVPSNAFKVQELGSSNIHLPPSYLQPPNLPGARGDPP